MGAISSVVRLARVIHVVSAVWVIILAMVIIVDVMGRAIFSAPLQGTTEVLRMSVVAVTFLQLPLAIFSGSMLRTEIFADALPPVGRKLLRALCYLMGFALFALIAYSSWNAAFDAFRIGAYEGEGALRVPTWPVRFLIIATSAFAALAYLMMLWLDWTEQLEQELAYPGILQFDADMNSAPSGDQGER